MRSEVCEENLQSRYDDLLKADQDRAHHSALLAIVIELKLKKLQGEPLPESLAELSLTLQEFLAPHRDCLLYKPSEQSIELVLRYREDELRYEAHAEVTARTVNLGKSVVIAR